MINHQLLSGAQIIKFNPILEELSSIKCSYLKLFLDFIDWSGCNNSVWTKAEKNFYFKLLGDELCGSFDWKIDWKKYSMYFFTDLAAVIGYNHSTGSLKNIVGSFITTGNSLSPSALADKEKTPDIMLSISITTSATAEVLFK